MAYVVVIDVSKWQHADKVPYKELKAHGVSLVFIKASMGGGYDRECDAHVKAVRAAGLLVGLYHWCDPTQSNDRQANFFSDQIRKYKPDYICYDVEHWWDSWDAYYSGTAGRLSATQVVTNFRTIYKKVYRDTQFPYDRTFQYSAKWFVDLYGAPLITAIREFPGRNWWADYTQLWLSNWEISWETWEWLWGTHFAGREPRMPDNTLGWDLWQVQSRIIVPPVHGINLRLDTNCCSEAFATELIALAENGEVPELEPEPEPEPEWPEGAIKKVSVTARALNIRKGPHVYNPKAGAAMLHGTEVYIYEIVGLWGRIEVGACIWTHLGYTQEV